MATLGEFFCKINLHRHTVFAVFFGWFSVHCFQKKIFNRTTKEEEWKKQHCKLAQNIPLQTHLLRNTSSSSWQLRVVLVEYGVFYTLYTPSHFMRMVYANQLFNFQRWGKIGFLYASHGLRCTGYTWKAALNWGKPQESGITVQSANQRAH